MLSLFYPLSVTSGLYLIVDFTILGVRNSRERKLFSLDSEEHGKFILDETQSDTSSLNQSSDPLRPVAIHLFREIHRSSSVQRSKSSRVIRRRNRSERREIQKMLVVKK